MVNPLDSGLPGLVHFFDVLEMAPSSKYLLKYLLPIYANIYRMILVQARLAGTDINP